ALGFVASTDGSGFSSAADVRNRVMGKVREAMRPEFLNRIDEIIVFHEHNRDAVMQMVDLMTKRLTGQLENQGLGIELTQSAKELLAEKGYDPQLGARPLRRAIQRMIEDVLSEKILYKEFHAGEIIVVDTEDDPDRPGDRKLSFHAVEGFQPPAAVELATTAAPEIVIAEPPAPTE
ncbi:MAG: NDP-hexose 4-ketoreductase, partial [Ilumatobacteraceae bacterium]